MSKEKIQAIINILNRTLKQDIRPKVADAIIENLLEQERKKNKFDISITHPINHNSK